jgi:hypothetical protein
MEHLWLRQRRHTKLTSSWSRSKVNDDINVSNLILFLLTCGNIVEDSGGEPQLLAAGLRVVVTVTASHHDPFPSHNRYSTQREGRGRGQVVISANVSWGG